MNIPHNPRAYPQPPFFPSSFYLLILLLTLCILRLLLFVLHPILLRFFLLFLLLSLGLFLGASWPLLPAVLASFCTLPACVLLCSSCVLLVVAKPFRNFLGFSGFVPACFLPLLRSRTCC